MDDYVAGEWRYYTAGSGGTRSGSNKKEAEVSVLTWEQHVLTLLTKLQTTKAFEMLSKDLKDRINELVRDAPSTART